MCTVCSSPFRRSYLSWRDSDSFFAPSVCPSRLSLLSFCSFSSLRRVSSRLLSSDSRSEICSIMVEALCLPVWIPVRSFRILMICSLRSLMPDVMSAICAAREARSFSASSICSVHVPASASRSFFLCSEVLSCVFLCSVSVFSLEDLTFSSSSLRSMAWICSFARSILPAWFWRSSFACDRPSLVCVTDSSIPAISSCVCSYWAFAKASWSLVSCWLFLAVSSFAFAVLRFCSYCSFSTRYRFTSQIFISSRLAR